MSDLTKKILIGLVYTLVIVSTTYYLSPTKTITKTETKTMEVVREVQASNTHTKTIERTKPDGTKTTITDTTNSTNTSTDTDLASDTSTEKTVERSKNGMSVALLAGLDVTNLQGGYIFAGQVALPLPILPISILLQGQSNKTGMIGLELKLP